MMQQSCAVQLLALLAVASFLGLSGAATLPAISEVFSAATTIQIATKTNITVISGTGVFISDQPHNKRFERFNVTDRNRQHENVYRLERYDLRKSFEIITRNGVNSSCHVRPEEGQIPLFWDWLKEAQHSTVSIGGVTYDYWSLTRGFATVGVAVTASAPNQPVYLIVDGAERVTRIKFDTWDTSPPKEAHFDIPPTCNGEADREQTSVGCVSRNTMIARAQVWVDNHVPYSQSGSYQGYRTDCSGYVSMAWETSKPGYTTFTMHDIAHPISKNDLAPGDVLLCASEHVVLFGGWTSGAKNQYIAFEETRPGEGTVKRATPYPYWYNTGCFKPYRYNSVC